MGISRRSPGRSVLDLPRSERHGWALGLLGVLCGVGGLPVTACGWYLYAATFRDGSLGWSMVLSALAIPPGVMVLAWGNIFIRASGRHFTEVVSSPEELHGRRYCLYLRSFEHDQPLSDVQKLPLLASAVRAWWSIGRTEEEYLAMVLRRVGPLVTAGIPGGLAPYMGATRLYLPSDGWQEPVRELMLRARLVVIALGPGAGTMWELVEALRSVPPERLLLVVPMERDEYEAFRDKAAAALSERARAVEVATGEAWSPPSLPDYPGNREVNSTIQGLVHFSATWAPTFVRLARSPAVQIGGRTLHSSWFGGCLNTAVVPFLERHAQPALVPAPWRRPADARRAAKVRVFVSYDRRHDEATNGLIRALSTSEDSPFVVMGCSTERRSPTGDDATRQQIRDADVVVVVCGEHTDTAVGVSAEVSMARDESTEYILVGSRGRPARRCKKPKAAASIDALYSLTWPALKQLVVDRG